MFAAYNRIDKADLLSAADGQFALAEELDHVWHAGERLAKLAQYIATIVTDDLDVQHSATASDDTHHKYLNETLSYTFQEPGTRLQSPGYPNSDLNKEVNKMQMY